MRNSVHLYESGSMNIFTMIIRRSDTTFVPLQNVRYASMAVVIFATRRDEKKYLRAGLHHEPGVMQGVEPHAEKYRAFNLLVDGNEMIGRIIEKRYLRSVVGEPRPTMLVECHPRRSGAAPVVHVTIPFP